MPSIIEFFGYLFHFQGVAIGPGCTFNDYIEYMNGENFRKFKEALKDEHDLKLKNGNNEPSVKVKKTRSLAQLKQF